MVNFPIEKVHPITHEILNEVPQRLTHISLRQNLLRLAKITVLKDRVHSVVNALNRALNVHVILHEPPPHKRLPAAEANKIKHVQEFHLPQLQNDRPLSDVKNVQITAVFDVLLS